MFGTCVKWFYCKENLWTDAHPMQNWGTWIVQGTSCYNSQLYNFTLVKNIKTTVGFERMLKNRIAHHLSNRYTPYEWRCCRTLPVMMVGLGTVKHLPICFKSVEVNCCNIWFSLSIAEIFCICVAGFILCRSWFYFLRFKEVLSVRCLFCLYFATEFPKYVVLYLLCVAWVFNLWFFSTSLWMWCYLLVLHKFYPFA